MTPPPRLILLDPTDTILVCAGAVAPGDRLVIDSQDFAAFELVPVGHKVARRNLMVGENVIKYGASIGSMTADVRTGGWVHSHNMKSDYLASHTRDTLTNEDK
jgi:D-threo-aldose 1-dehydrogenase